MSTKPPRTPKEERRFTSRVSLPMDPQVSLIPTMLGAAAATTKGSAFASAGGNRRGRKGEGTHSRKLGQCRDRCRQMLRGLGGEIISFMFLRNDTVSKGAAQL